MEKNTILLSLDEYNELRDFKKAIEAGNVLTISSYCSSTRQWFGHDEALEELVRINKGLQDNYEELRTDYFKIIANVKKMSYWEFRRWRKS